MTGLRRLADLHWPELDGERPLLVVPVGSTEQHGPHLPFATDTLVAVALAEGLGATRPDVVVAPAVAYGSSGEHQGFPGTLSIGADALRLLLIELVRSAATSFRGVVLVNGHGGNLGPVGDAVALLGEQGHDVLAFSPRIPGGDAHAGRTETSLLLHLAPRGVRPGGDRVGTTMPLAELMPALRDGRLRDVAPDGILGDATGAGAVEGERLLAGQVAQLVAAVDLRWQP